jgi:hypothetical protein
MTNMAATSTSKILLVLLLLFILLSIPFAVIWALNTLFVLSIPYNFWTWLAMFIILMFFKGSSAKIK